MNVYLLVHRHPDGYVGTPETKAKWVAWFKEVGDALVDMGNPVLDDRAGVGKTGAALPPRMRWKMKQRRPMQSCAASGFSSRS